MSGSAARLRGFSVVFRATLAEALRGRRVSWGWPVLALLSLALETWTAQRGDGAVLAAFLFVGNFAILCMGGLPREEYRSGRATALLLGGVSRGTHYLGVGLAWTVVFLGGSFLFEGLVHAWALTLGETPLSLAAAVSVPLGFLPLVAAGWLLGLFLPGWANVAAILAIGIGLRMIEGAPETFGILSSAAALVVGSSGSRSCTLAEGGVTMLVLSAAARWLVFLGAGFLLAGTRYAGRVLGRVPLAARS